jgi:hypothetical protein
MLRGLRTTLRLLLLLLLLGVWGVVCAPLPSVVVFLGVDGLSQRALQETLDERPNGADFMRAALAAAPAVTGSATATMNARAQWTSDSATNWASILCGTPPNVHGVSSNTWRRESGCTRFPSVYTALGAAGIADHSLVTSWDLIATDVVGCGEAGGPGTCLHPTDDDGIEAAVTERATTTTDRFVFGMLGAVDHAGHVHGWGSYQQRREVRAADSRLERVHGALVASGRSFLLLTTADHGGIGLMHAFVFDVDTLRVPWFAWGSLAAPPATATVPPQIQNMDVAPTVLAVLGVAAPPEWAGGRAVLAALAAAPAAPAVPTALRTLPEGTTRCNYASPYHLTEFMFLLLPGTFTVWVLGLSCGMCLHLYVHTPLLL